MASCLSSGSLLITEITFFPEQLDFGSFTYSKQSICISIKTWQCKGKKNQKIKASMQFIKGLVLATWLHVVGTCSFLLRRTMAIYLSLWDVLTVFNFPLALFKFQKVNTMKYVACTIMHKAWTWTVGKLLQIMQFCVEARISIYYLFHLIGIQLYRRNKGNWNGWKSGY